MNVISLKNISKSYSGKNVFDNFNCEIKENEFVCITGESGSGKSTLLNIMGLLEQPDKGEIEIKGYRNPLFYSKNGVYLLRNEISYLFQNYGLIENETVKYNLAIAQKFKSMKKQDRLKEMEETLKKVGLENIIYKKIFCLSGGEQQRVALAKCLIKPSSIVLADEPTGSLDEKNKLIVMETLKQLHNMGKTVVIVTHDESIVNYYYLQLTILSDYEKIHLVHYYVLSQCSFLKECLYNPKKSELRKEIQNDYFTGS